MPQKTAMTDWKRKHLDELACAVKCFCTQDSTLSPSHRENLEEVYRWAKHFSTGSQSGGATNVGQVIAALCDVCKEIGSYPCQGRDVWSQPCTLVATMGRQTPL